MFQRNKCVMCGEDARYEASNGEPLCKDCFLINKRIEDEKNKK